MSEGGVNARNDNKQACAVCAARIYAYDADGNRTSLTTRPSSSKKCPTSTVKHETVETHHYDEANRLIDSGVAYNAFGDISTLPATDADGSELTNSYSTELDSVCQGEVCPSRARLEQRCLQVSTTPVNIRVTVSESAIEER